ncbi:MAG: hypothetical protein PHQ04_09020 [Opitutaceae bacterium]|nr:hypothetical protein [Opitutaceae bacterium]
MQQKSFVLKVLCRERGYLLAAMQQGEGEVALLFTEITNEWLQKHFPELRRADSPQISIQEWLDRACGHP